MQKAYGKTNKNDYILITVDTNVRVGTIWKIVGNYPTFVKSHKQIHVIGDGIENIGIRTIQDVGLCVEPTSHLVRWAHETLRH